MNKDGELRFECKFAWASTEVNRRIGQKSKVWLTHYYELYRYHNCEEVGDDGHPETIIHHHPSTKIVLEPKYLHCENEWRSGWVHIGPVSKEVYQQLITKDTLPMGD